MTLHGDCSRVLAMSRVCWDRLKLMFSNKNYFPLPGGGGGTGGLGQAYSPCVLYCVCCFGYQQLTPPQLMIF